MNALQNWRDEYPFQSYWMEIDGRGYHYVDEGTGESPLLAVHGNPTWSFYYRQVVAHLRTSMRVIAVDHVGCGLSDKPQDYDYCLDQHAANLGAFIQAKDLRNITLLVHDWGGAIGLLAAVKDPSRFSRLIMLNTGAFPPPFVPWRIAACRIPLVGTLAIRGFNLFCRAATSMAMSRTRLSASATAGLLAPYGSWHDRIAVDRFVQDIPTRPSHRTWKTLESLEAGLPGLAHLPTMFVWGMKDWCFRPECLDRLLTHFPDARQVQIPDAGHYVLEDATADVLEAIEHFTEAHAALEQHAPA